jgi:nucleoside-diphosphate-sugar epimerase
MKSRNLLCIGASSAAANYYLGRSFVDFNIYGFSSIPHKFIPTYRYSDIASISHLKFSKIIIFSSGVPSSCKYKDDYAHINNSIKSILNNINLEDVDLTYISSFSVFNKNIDVICDHTPYSPDDLYGESKVDMEEYLLTSYAKISRQLNILRLPVYLYKGVKNNFIGSAIDKIKKGDGITLSNPEAFFYSVIDDRSLFLLDGRLDAGVNLINCCSNGDIKFKDIANLLKCYGAQGIKWVGSDRPSVKILPSPHLHSFFDGLSSSEIIQNWLISEKF